MITEDQFLDAVATVLNDYEAEKIGLHGVYDRILALRATKTAAASGDAKDMVYADVQAERARQNEQWGGPEHDDQHTSPEWTSYIEKQIFLRNGVNDRKRFVKIAALAVAAVESMDRCAAIASMESGQ